MGGESGVFASGVGNVDPPPLDLDAFTAPGPARGRLQDAVDLRKSPWLYRSDAELRRRLFELAQRPELARLWRRRLHDRDLDGARLVAESAACMSGSEAVLKVAVGHSSSALPGETVAADVASAEPATVPQGTAAASVGAAAVDDTWHLLRSLRRLDDRALAPLYRTLLRLPPSI